MERSEETKRQEKVGFGTNTQGSGISAGADNDIYISLLGFQTLGTLE
jgi:hypothetical protein